MRRALVVPIRYNECVTPGQLIREARERHNLSQERLALRAGTRQSAISRLERDDLSPSVDTLDILLKAMGEQLELSGKPLERDYDPLHRKANAERTPEERLALAISWNRMAGRLADAGRRARGA